LRVMSSDMRKATKQAVQTLGGLLYRNQSQPRIPEKEWVELLQGVAAGDTTALGTLYMWTDGIVFTLILKITRNRRIAEDLTVEFFHDLWSEAASYDAAQGTVLAWMMNRARSRALLARKVRER